MLENMFYQRVVEDLLKEAGFEPRTSSAMLQTMRTAREHTTHYLQVVIPLMLTIRTQPMQEVLRMLAWDRRDRGEYLFEGRGEYLRVEGVRGLCGPEVGVRVLSLTKTAQGPEWRMGACWPKRNWSFTQQHGSATLRLEPDIRRPGRVFSRRVLSMHSLGVPGVVDPDRVHARELSEALSTFLYGYLCGYLCG